MAEPDAPDGHGPSGETPSAPTASPPPPGLDLQKLLQIARAAITPQTQENTLARRLLERAAVLGTYTLPQLTQGLEPAPETNAAAEEVLRDSVVVPQGGRRQWLLNPSSRISTLAQLGQRALSLLDEVSSPGTKGGDALGRAIAALLRGTVTAPAELPTEDLRAYAAAADWLKDVSRPARERLAEWRAELQRRELIEPLAQIAKGFVGRDKDVAALRDFVGIVPPESRFEGWGRRLKELLTSQKDPLVVHGIGGIGKSTLMAHFIVTHAAVSSERGFPFAYLDFDRARLDPGNPATLLNELLEQVSAQFPAMAVHRQEWARMLQSERNRTRVEQLTRSSAASVDDYATDSSASMGLSGMFASWLRQHELADRPFLMVLDTFEEVQTRGASAVDAVFDLIHGLSELPQLRVVIAGRAPVEERAVTSRALGDFDKKAALAFLRAQGLEAGLPEAVYDKVGGNPLSLRLSVQLVRREAFGTVKKEDLERVFGKRDNLYIQGYLYTRLLRHIGDARVEKLAHPGLVLRRITPQIIGEVLVPVLTRRPGTGLEAVPPQELYRALKSEVSLVFEEDGALVHRKDVRSVMLEMQRQDEPSMFETLNREAVSYYMRHSPDEPLHRRERAYHQLMLAEASPEAVLNELSRSDLQALASSADELPAQARAVVRALLALGLTAKERETLSDSVWSTYAYRRGQALLAAGSPEDAFTLFRERRWLVESGPAKYSLALAMFNLLNWPEANRLLREAVEDGGRATRQLPPHEADELRGRSLIEAGFLAWYHDDTAYARRCFDDAEHLAGEAGLPFLQIEALLGMTVLGAEAGAALQRQLAMARPGLWRQNLLTLRRVVFLGAAPATLMRTAVLHLGVQLRDEKTLLQLHAELGQHLGIDALRLVDQALGSSSGGDDADRWVPLERAVGADLAKLAGSEAPPDMTPYLRGRFAPWKIPLRSALLSSYPHVTTLCDLYADWHPASAQRLKDRLRSPRALVDALIDDADQRGQLMPVSAELLRHPQAMRAPPDGAEALLHAMQRYANQGRAASIHA